MWCVWQREEETAFSIMHCWLPSLLLSCLSSLAHRASDVLCWRLWRCQVGWGFSATSCMPVIGQGLCRSLVIDVTDFGC